MDNKYDGTSRRRILQAGALGAGAALVPAVSGALPAGASTSGAASSGSASASASASGLASGQADNPRFTVAVVPDTQYLFDLDRGDPEPLTASFEYLIEQRAADNIVFTAHLGDVVENAQATEFAQADPVFRALDRARMPYSVLAGNHDINSRTDDQRGDSAYLRTFGPQRFRRMSTYGGSSPDGYNAYHVFRAAGRQWLLLAMDWRPSDKGFAWARQVIADHPRLPGDPDHPRSRVRRCGRSRGEVLRPRQPDLGTTCQRQRPDLPDTERALLAVRPGGPEECRRQRCAPAHHQLPGPLLRRQRDDPAVPLRPGPQHDPRRDHLTVDPRAETGPPQHPGGGGGRAHRRHEPLQRAHRLHQPLRRIRPGSRAGASAGSGSGDPRHGRVLAPRRHRRWTRGGPLRPGQPPHPRVPSGQHRGQPETIDRAPFRPTGPRELDLCRRQEPDPRRLPANRRQRTAEPDDVPAGLHDRSLREAGR